MPIKAGFATLGFADVRYVDGDGLGITLACFTMLPYWVGIHFIALVHSRRELHALLALAGLVASDVVCMLLKRLLKQDRPTSCAYLDKCDSYGMPSQHAQFMFFLATLVYFLARRNEHVFQLGKERVLLWPVAAVVAWSRVYLGYHTWFQVVAGAALGGALGAGWARAMEAAESLLYPRLEALAICKFLRLRDTSRAGDVLEAERAPPGKKK